jgi:uncharacterized protein YabE (DUF348 family)
MEVDSAWCDSIVPLALFIIALVLFKVLICGFDKHNHDKEVVMVTMNYVKIGLKTWLLSVADIFCAIGTSIASADVLNWPLIIRPIHPQPYLPRESC